MPSPDPQPEPKPAGLFGHLKRLVAHVAELLRAYVSLFLADAEERAAGAMRRVLWATAALVLGLTGAILVVSGLAATLDAWLGPRWPGGGRVLIGLGLLVAVVVLALAKLRRGKARQ